MGFKPICPPPFSFLALDLRATASLRALGTSAEPPGPVGSPVRCPERLTWARKSQRWVRAQPPLAPRGCLLARPARLPPRRPGVFFPARAGFRGARRGLEFSVRACRAEHGARSSAVSAPARKTGFSAVAQPGARVRVDAGRGPGAPRPQALQPLRLGANGLLSGRQLLGGARAVEEPGRVLGSGQSGGLGAPSPGGAPSVAGACPVRWGRDGGGSVWERYRVEFDFSGPAEGKLPRPRDRSDYLQGVRRPNTTV